MITHEQDDTTTSNGVIYGGSPDYDSDDTTQLPDDYTDAPHPAPQTVTSVLIIGALLINMASAIAAPPRHNWCKPGQDPKVDKCINGSGSGG